MSQTLYLYYTDSLQNISEQSHIQWLSDLDGESLEWQRCSLSELDNIVDGLSQDHPGEIGCTLMLSAENLFATQVLLPGKQAKHLKQALPFLVEEKLAKDVEDMHLATGNRLADNRYPVVAIERESFQRLLDLLKNQGLAPSLALGDIQLLQNSELYIGESRSLLNLHSGQAIAVENEDLELVLNSAFNSEDSEGQGETPILAINYNSVIPSEIQLQLQALESSQSASVEIASEALPQSELLSGRLNNYKGLNLLQGEFTAKKTKSQSAIRWQPFAIAATLLLALQLSYFIGCGIYFSAQAETYAADTEKLYRQYFPQDRRIRDVKRQAAAHLRNSGTGNSGFISLLGALGSSWKNPGNSALAIQQLRYNAKRSQMTLEIQAKTINQLDTLQRDISSKGVKAELMSANESDSGVRGRLQLGG